MCFASDGDLMEGISHEAIAFAGNLRLSKLIVLWDDNGISIDGPLSLSDTDRSCQAAFRGLRLEGRARSTATTRPPFSPRAPLPRQEVRTGRR